MKNRLFRCFSWTALTAVLIVFAGGFSAMAHAEALQPVIAALGHDANGWLYGAAFGTTALSSNAKTLADWAKMQDPDGKVAVIANLLSQTNEILEDAMFMEGNLPTGHRISQVVGLPAVYWRSYNKGVPSSASKTAQIDEAIGMLEAYAVVDKDLALLNGNTAAFRLQEDNVFLEAMNQTQAQTLIYGNPATDPRQFMGLSPRYSNLSTAGNKQNVIGAGGSSSTLTSIWLVVWGENTVFCPFPKGSQAGLLHQDQGELTVLDDNGNRYQAFQTHYQWKNGLCVKDWRYVVRICNIETNPATAGGLGSATGTQPDLIKLMSHAMNRIPFLGAGKACFYMNRTVFEYLQDQAMAKSAAVLKVGDGLSQFGTPQQWMKFMGIPLRKVDAITNTESTVS